MPNWVFNNLYINGNEEDINKLVNQVSKSFDTFQDVFNEKTGEHSKETDRKSTRLNSSHVSESRMPSSA